MKYKFIQPITIGRDEKDRIRILDQSVSRSHVKIRKEPSGFRIIDQDSKNGTYVNGKRIKNRLLENDDQIVLGSTKLLFSVKTIQYDQLEQTVSVSKIKKALDPGYYDHDEKYLENISITNLRKRFLLLQKVNTALSGELDINSTFKKILDEIFQIFPADRGAILSLKYDSGKIEIACSKIRVESVFQDEISISKTILNRVIDESVGLLVDDAIIDDHFGTSESIVKEAIRSVLCVPFIRDKQIIGIIYLDTLSKEKKFTEADLELLIALATPASIHLQNALYIEQLKKSHWDTIQALAQAVDARDAYTVGHNKRVSQFAVTIASYLEWPKEKRGLVEFAGILHDIGKIGISDTVLLKPRQLDEDEIQSMQSHPEIGAKIVNRIDFLRPVIPYILYHHERWDGRGYPYGLKGESIPEEGRLLAVCDAYDAMITNRPYRKGLEPEAAIEELIKNKEKQFDPQFVNAFVNAWKSKKIKDFVEEESIDMVYSDVLDANIIIPPYSAKPLIQMTKNTRPQKEEVYH